MVRRPAELSRSSASALSISWRRLSKRRAKSSTVRPASVRTRSFAVRNDRSISFSPISVSRRWSASEIAGWVRSSFSAAREKLRSATTVAKTCSAYSSMGRVA